MIKTLPPVQDVAYDVEIPGSRVGPDDGPWPRPYHILAEAELARELELTAKPLSFPLGSRYSAHGVNFQPCHVYSTQDRYTVQQLNVHGRVWSFTGVFDGMCPPAHSKRLTNPLSRSSGRPHRRAHRLSPAYHRQRTSVQFASGTAKRSGGGFPNFIGRNNLIRSRNCR